jgi:hypothetical protein
MLQGNGDEAESNGYDVRHCYELLLGSVLRHKVVVVVVVLVLHVFIHAAMMSHVFALVPAAGAAPGVPGVGGLSPDIACDAGLAYKHILHEVEDGCWTRRRGGEGEGGR